MEQLQRNVSLINLEMEKQYQNVQVHVKMVLNLKIIMLKMLIHFIVTIENLTTRLFLLWIN